MNDYNDGQVWGWNGGDCPVHPKTKVRFWLRSGRTSDENTAYALRWCHKSDGDIIAFQVVKAYVEPKVMWVNEYPNGLHTAYRTEHDARAGASTNHTRIAVKYVEARDD